VKNEEFQLQGRKKNYILFLLTLSSINSVDFSLYEKAGGNLVRETFNHFRF